MVSVNTIPVKGFHFMESMSISGANSELMEDQSKKIRKPYTITKSRESWSDQEHDKFLEALQLFDRDWKKIEAFVGSKTVIQIRSHAQKYFLKVQKNGASEHVPPPRPKRKASHPYPHKAPKNVPHRTHAAERGYRYTPDLLPIVGNSVTGPTLHSWSFSSIPPINATRVTIDDELFMPNSSSLSSSIESTPHISQTNGTVDFGSKSNEKRVAPDFAQVYRFIGSVFDPNSTGHLQKLKQMDSINLETALLLMRNLTVNLTSPEFKDHIKLISSYDATDSERGNSGSACEFSYKSEILST